MSLVLLFNDDYYGRRRLGGGGYADEKLTPDQVEELRKHLFPEPEQKPDKVKQLPKPLKKKVVKVSKANKPEIVARAKEYDSNKRQLSLSYGLLTTEILKNGINSIILWYLLKQKQLEEQKLQQLFIQSLFPKEEEFDLLAFAMAENKTAYIVGQDDIERLILTIENI